MERLEKTCFVTEAEIWHDLKKRVYGLCSIRDARECNGHINWGTSACVQTGTPGHERLQQTCFVTEAEIWHDPMSGTPLRPVQYHS